MIWLVKADNPCSGKRTKTNGERGTDATSFNISLEKGAKTDVLARVIE